MSSKIAVIGDVLLDKYTIGSVHRINPEAPVPIIHIKEERFGPGGAGNVAANLAKLGAEVDLFGIVGSDENTHILNTVLKQWRINSKLIIDDTRPTIVKQRFIADGQQLLRADYEQTDTIGDHHINKIKAEFGNYEAIIISDYAKGMICEDLMDFLKKYPLPIMADVKPKNIDLFKGVSFIFPNIEECFAISREQHDISGAQKIAREYDTEVILTRGSKGIAYIHQEGEPLLFAAQTREVSDVSGAGDTVIATFTFLYCQGEAIEDCVHLANKAAGIAVSKIGCYQVSNTDLYD